MSVPNPVYAVNRLNVDLLAKSLERLSIYDGQGKSKLLKIPPKVDFERILGNLDLEKIDARMWAKERGAEGAGGAGVRGGGHRRGGADQPGGERPAGEGDHPEELHNHRPEPEGGGLSSSTS